ncbi:MAG: hypothetical protein ACK50J_25400, partial [Planctomyces sp.]
AGLRMESPVLVVESVIVRFASVLESPAAVRFPDLVRCSAMSMKLALPRRRSFCTNYLSE